MSARAASASPDTAPLAPTIAARLASEGVEPLTRHMALEIDRAAIAERGERGDSDDRIPLALSSETPVERWFGKEILDHSPGAVDLSRAERGLPLLLDHDTRELVGRLEDVAVGKDRKIRGLARFGSAAEAQQAKRDVLEGIRVDVSVGYRIRELVLEKQSDEEGDTYRATKWEPMEASLVSVPADVTVGVGRDADRAALPVRLVHPDPAGPSTAPQAKEQTVSDKSTAAQNGAAPTAPAAPAQVQDRGEQIVELCELAGVAERAGDFIRSGKPLAEIRAELRKLKAERMGATAPINAPAPSIEDYREKGQRFSVARALEAARTGDWRHAGYERAVSADRAKALGRTLDATSFIIPTVERLSDEEIAKRTAHTVGTAGNGGNLVFTEYGGFIDLLRKRSAIMGIGATVLPGLQGNVAFPRQTAAGSAVWMGESSGSDVAESNMTFDQVTLSPKTLMARQRYSKQLLAQNVINIDALIRNDLARIIALEIDRAAMHGSGASNQPTGLYGISGVNAVAFGGAITYVNVTKMEEAIEADDADIGVMAFITTPEVKQDAKTTQVFSSTNGAPVWTGSAAEGEMGGYRAVASNQLAKNLGAGTNEHAIAFGAWDQFLLGEWGGVEVTVDPFTLAGQNDVRIITAAFVDFDVRHAESFAKGTGLTVS